MFARFAWHINPECRKAVCANLAFVFPEKSERELARIGESSAVNFIRYLVDFFSMDKRSSAWLIERVRWVGYERIEALDAQGKGFMFMTGHLGNWEIAGAAMTARGHPIASLALPHGDAALNALFDAQRKRYGMDVCPVSHVRHCFRAVKEGKTVALLGDRDFTGNGVDVDCGGFFARLPKGPAALAAAMKIPLVPGFLFREGDHFVGYIGEPMDMTDAGSEQEHLEACGRMIVSYIKQYPEQWFMFEPYFFKK